MDRLDIRVEESDGGLLLRLDGILDGQTVRAVTERSRDCHSAR